jgi:hypothetical protein
VTLTRSDLLHSLEMQNMFSRDGQLEPASLEIAVEDVGIVPYPSIEFFALFSRLEFALLASGYAGGDVGENAWVLWERVANDVHKSFLADVKVDEDVAILFREPARTLVRITAGGCEFKDVPAPETTAEILLQVRTIRNNLFHGSKVYFTDRDRCLIRAGIHVIRHLLNAFRFSERTRKVGAAWAYADVGYQ